MPRNNGSGIVCSKDSVKCSICQKVQRKDNIQRHFRSKHPGGDAVKYDPVPCSRQVHVSLSQGERGNPVENKSFM